MTYLPPLPQPHKFGNLLRQRETGRECLNFFRGVPLKAEEAGLWPAYTQGSYTLGCGNLKGQIHANPPRERSRFLEPSKGEITLLLAKWRDGEPSAFEELMPLVYPHLREVAAAYVRRERNPDVLQATSLVHELYLRLLNQKKAGWEDRQHFYTFAAKVMRMILIDHARGNQTQMRGGGMEYIPLSDDLPWVEVGSAELLDLNRALDELGAIDPHKVQLVELRYFLGCTAEETAELVQVSKATVDRDLKFIKSWLYRRIHPTGDGNKATTDSL